ncbi:MAG: sodium:solute symporter family transporter [Acidobacteriota bacterium]
MHSLNIFDIIIVLAYFVFMLGIGWYFMRINKGGKEYFAGGSMIPWWMSGMTLYMANFSAYTFTGLAGMTYTTGWFMLLSFLVGPLSYFIGTQMTAVRWRRSRSISPVEYTYTRFNVTTQQMISWVTSTSFILAGGVQLASTCILLAPFLGVPVTTIVIALGIIILLYTFLGGVWAVSVTDVVQGVILLSITCIVLPLSLGLIGGFGTLIDKIPPLQLSHTYNGVHYDLNWIISVFIITTIGFAGGSAQRFYSVKDEKDAKRTGRFAALLACTTVTVFGIPMLVTRVLWPDLTQVEFFKPYLGNNPQNLVYVALCMKLLPNGLLGVFIAAMLAATMSTLSSVYNMLSSIFSRDIYQWMRGREMTDGELLKVGRLASIGVGVIVTVLAYMFATSTYGIFNLMQQFFVLFNIPIAVPLAFGLLFKKVPRWSAAAAITWGLIAGATARFLLNWDLGIQGYFSTFMTFIIFAVSPWLAAMYKKRPGLLAGLSGFLAAAMEGFFVRAAWGTVEPWQHFMMAGSAIALGATLYGFSKLFTHQTDEETALVTAFFKKLATPVDVMKEVYGAGKSPIATLPLVGGTTMTMGALMSLIFLTDIPTSEKMIVGILVFIMVAFGAALWAAGRKVAANAKAATAKAAMAEESI